MGGAASRGLNRAAPAVVRRAPAPVAPAAREPAVASLKAERAPGDAVPAALPEERDSGLPEVQGKDAPLESMMLRLGGAITGRVVDEREKQATRTPLARPRRAASSGDDTRAGRLRAEDLCELFRRHRDEGADAATLAAAYTVDAELLAAALRAARLPRIREVPLGSPPVLRRMADDADER